MRRFSYLVPLLVLSLLSVTAWGGQESHDAESGHGGGPLTTYLLGIVVILLAAKLGGEAFERLSMPSVLGELVVGMVLGNLFLIGFTGFESLKSDRGLEMTAEVGVILLLFEVGLESKLHELMEVGKSAMLVAILGVVAPMLLGYGVSSFFLPEAGWYVHLFIGATLAATSVGITARVLQDLHKTKSKEARIILGAAVVDDVMGLIILAVVSGLVTSIGGSGEASVKLLPVLWIIGKALFFLAGVIIGGRWIITYALRLGAHFRVPGIPLVLSIGHCFAMSALASWIGLAPIVGAFAAGLVLDEACFEVYRQRGEREIGELIRPITTLVVPVFFVMMGLRVDLTSFASMNILAFAAVLSVAAVIGKQVCSLGVIEKGVNRIVVGVGMIPRGEVGLIFAAIGAKLMVGDEPLFSTSTVSALVVMVMVTTLLTPPLLKFLFQNKNKS